MRNVYLLLCLCLSGTPNLMAQAPWLAAHRSIELPNQPATTDLYRVIGTNIGYGVGDLGQYNGLIPNVRNFNLMENDWSATGGRRLPREGAPNANTCSVENIFCNQANCAELVDPASGKFGFNSKSWYVAWKNTIGFEQTYASLEAIFIPEDGNCTGDQFTRSYPNKFFTTEELGGDDLETIIAEYARNFAITYCPDDPTQPCLVDVLEMGNEPWGPIPGTATLQRFMRAVVQGMNQAYGTPNATDASGWRMKLSSPAFVAYSDDPGCSDNDRRQYVEEMLPVDVRPFVDYLSVHNYAFGYSDEDNGAIGPCNIRESPESDRGAYLTLKNMVKWKDLNMPWARVNITEFGWQADQGDGLIVGEAGQSAYVMRAFLLANRYDLHKAFQYSLFDREAESLYASTSFFSRAYGGQSDPGALSTARYSLKTVEKLANGDLSDKRFLKALVEDNDPANGAFAYVYGDSEGRPTHLVAWRAEAYTSPLNDYPVAASTFTQITLPTSFSVASGADYFHLSWDATRDGAVGSSGVVTVAGAASNVVEVKLSGVPIVIPLAPNDCRYSSTGELLNCESCPSPQPAGTACDDGDENTENDVILADGCTCRGKVIEPEPCTPATAEVRYTACGGAVEIGVSDNRVRIVSNTYSETLIARVRNETWSYSVQLCNDFTAGANCIAEATVEIPQAEIDRYDGAFVLDLQNCDNLAITVGGSNSGGGTDNDGDGVCAVDDCNDQDPSVPAPPGTACDDGDSETTDDSIQADGCSCAGTVAQTCNVTVPQSCAALITCVEVVDGTVRVTPSAATPPFRVDVHRADYTPVTGVCDSWQGGAPACTGTVASAALGQGDYLLRVQGSDQTDDVACWIPFTITPKSTVSVTGGSPGGTISLYPNPGSQIVYLQMTPTEIITGVEIYSSVGKRVRTFVGNVRELDVTDLPGGAYFVKIQGQKRTVSRTLLLE